MQSNQELLNLFSLPTKSTKKHQPTKPNSAVYLIYCKKAKRAYVGSGQIDDKGKLNRLAYHKSRLTKGNHPNRSMQSDWLLYSDSFIFKILETCPTNEARQREQLALMHIKMDGKFQLYNINNACKF